VPHFETALFIIEITVPPLEEMYDFNITRLPSMLNSPKSLGGMAIEPSEKETKQVSDKFR